MIGLSISLLMTTVVPSFAATMAGFPTPPTLAGGTAQFHPHAGISESYDSNIFLSPGGGNNQPVLSSWIHTPDLGFGLIADPSDHHRAELNYDAADRIYSKDPSANNAVIQNADAGYWYEGPRGQTAHVFDSYLNTVDPADSELTARRRRWLNTTGIELDEAPGDGRLSFGADGQEDRYKYVSDDITLGPGLDRYEQLFGVKAGWQVQPKTILYAAYHRQLIHYTDAPSPSKNSKGQLADVGVQGELSDKVTGHVQTGVVFRHYDEAAAPGLDRDTKDVTALVELRYLPQERTTVALTVSRLLQEATFSINQFYVATGADLELTHGFLWGPTASLGGGYSLNTYPAASPSASGGTLDRRDDLYRATAGITYPIRDWLKASATYRYQSRFSHGFSEFDYRDHIATVSLTATF